MRVLVDECVPRRLKRHLPGHEVRTVPEVGWAGKKNGELLRLAAREFDAFVTVTAAAASGVMVR
jgi:predicted nuclease of predicted toxin-antitoxin system